MDIYWNMKDKELLRIILERLPKDNYEYDVIKKRLDEWKRYGVRKEK